MARGAALAALVALALAGPAAAATPQEIYKDLADNGRLDRHYAPADINRALHSPALRRYQAHENRSRSAPLPVRTAPAAGGDDRPGTLPFSGLDLAFFGGVGAPLLLLGASLGRLARVRAHEEL